MMIESLREILNGYLIAKDDDLAEHPIAKILIHEIPAKITSLLSESDKKRFKVKGSSGMGNWAHVPWIAIKDHLVSANAQSGFYPVITFRVDMKGFYISINQGVGYLMKAFPKTWKQILQSRALYYRSLISNDLEDFKVREVKLNDSDTSDMDVSKYELGHVAAKYYSIESLPNTEALITDINKIIGLHKLLTYKLSINVDFDNIEIINVDLESTKGIELLNKQTFHRRIERNQDLIGKVKKIQGYTCKACKFNFVDNYGEIGKDFIEAHHLIPLHTLKQDSVELDAEKDFAVLCSNCHRMIHRLSDPSDLSQLIELITQNRGN